MTQGRKAYGPTMKSRRDFKHFKKMGKECQKANSIEDTILKKDLYQKLKKPRWQDK